MKLYLVRHAKAGKRSAWEGPDALRPLTRAGQHQARGLARLLAGAPVQRILSGPSLRCRQTLEPLAERLSVPLEVEARLDEGQGPEAFLDLVRSVRDGVAVLCSHGAAISNFLAGLLGDASSGADEARCDKGGAWVLDGPLEGPLSASYLPPLKGPSRESARAERRRPSTARRARKTPPRIAALDLGSTSFHLLVAEITSGGDLRRVSRERVMLRLGAELAQGSRIPEPVCARAVETARQLRIAAEQAKAERLIPVATSALREAENGSELAERLGEVLGVPVSIVGGEEEARLIFTAVRRRLDLGTGVVAAADLGGGSLELAVGDAEGVLWETTLRLGVARLCGELVSSDPMTPSEAERVRKRVRQQIAAHRDRVQAVRPARCIGVGGTAGALARLACARRGEEPRSLAGGLLIPGPELAELEQLLERSSHDERLELAGMEAHRADLLPTGVTILSTLLAELGFDGITVCDWGLREGVVLREALGG